MRHSTKKRHVTHPRCAAACSPPWAIPCSEREGGCLLERSASCHLRFRKVQLNAASTSCFAFRFVGAADLRRDMIGVPTSIFERWTYVLLLGIAGPARLDRPGRENVNIRRSLDRAGRTDVGPCYRTTVTRRTRRTRRFVGQESLMMRYQQPSERTSAPLTNT